LVHRAYENLHGFRPSALSMTKPASSFRGNKATLPSKPCVACGLPMTWRRRWARNWDEVKFCSNACRRDKAGRV
jgi:hypothetical protein